MPTITGQRDIEFGPFRLDLRSRSLARDGVPVALGGRAFDVLAALAMVAGETVSKDTLLDQVWANLTVEENNLAVQISALRKTLGEGWISSVPSRGYRLTMPPKNAQVALEAGNLNDAPSIAVMPFACMSGEPDQESFSDGVADDIITELSRDRALFVVARSSSLVHRGRSVDAKQVGRELGVRYVLQGSVRREATHVRVNAQLIEATNGGHIWADRYDRALEHVFAIQNEISEAVATAVRRSVGAAEQRRMLRKVPGNPSSWEAYQRGLWHLRQNTPEGGELSRQNFRQACDIDPAFASGFSGLAFSYLSDAIFHGTLPFFDAGTLAEAEARKAIAIDPDDSDANAALAHAFFNAGSFDAALDYAKRAISLNRNSAWAHTTKATVLVFSGQYTKGRDEAFISLRLNPRDLTSPLMASVVVGSYYWEGNYGAALAAARRCLADYPTFAPLRRYIVAALGQLDRKQEAATALQAFMTAAPNVFSAMVRNRPSFLLHEQQDHLLEGLRKAGLRD